jgi:hypothetical protein
MAAAAGWQAAERCLQKQDLPKQQALSVAVHRLVEAQSHCLAAGGLRVYNAEPEVASAKPLGLRLAEEARNRLHIGCRYRQGQAISGACYAHSLYVFLLLQYLLHQSRDPRQARASASLWAWFLGAAVSLPAGGHLNANWSDAETYRRSQSSLQAHHRARPLHYEEGANGDLACRPNRRLHLLVGFPPHLEVLLIRDAFFLLAGWLNWRQTSFPTGAYALALDRLPRLPRPAWESAVS